MTGTLTRVAFTNPHGAMHIAVENEDGSTTEWVMTPKILRASSNPDAGLLPERGNCEVYELEDITTQIRH